MRVQQNVIDNLTVDAMHDVLEGICHYDMCHSISYFIKEKKYFTLETLNQRKKTFEYEETENICNDISVIHLKK